MFISTLAADNLSVDIEDGIGGTLIPAIFKRSEEDMLRNESDEEVLLSLMEVSLLFFVLIALREGMGLLERGVVGFAARSGTGGMSSSSSLKDFEGDVEAVEGVMMVGLEGVGSDVFFVGDRLRLDSCLLELLRDGDGDLDCDDIHFLRARLLKVSATERLGVFGCSELSPVRSRSSVVVVLSSGSSDGAAAFGTESLFLTFLDALRNISLFVEWAAPLIFTEVSGGSAKTFSEKVRLIPDPGAAWLAPGI